MKGVIYREVQNETIMWRSNVVIGIIAYKYADKLLSLFHRMLLHDNADHVLFDLIWNFFPHPPYSPDNGSIWLSDFRIIPTGFDKKPFIKF